jgi:hypothetical protein
VAGFAVLSVPRAAPTRQHRLHAQPMVIDILADFLDTASL